MGTGNWDSDSILGPELLPPSPPHSHFGSRPAVVENNERIVLSDDPLSVIICLVVVGPAVNQMLGILNCHFFYVGACYIFVIQSELRRTSPIFYKNIISFYYSISVLCVYRILI